MDQPPKRKWYFRRRHGFWRTMKDRMLVTLALYYLGACLFIVLIVEDVATWDTAAQIVILLETFVAVPLGFAHFVSLITKN